MAFNRTKHTILRTVLPLLLILMMSSCITNYSTHFLQNQPKDYGPAVLEDYKLRPNDELNIQFFSTNQEAIGMVSGTTSYYRIFPDSTVNLPYIDKVKIAGMSAREASHYLTETLKPYIAPDLTVKVTMAEKVYYVIGERSAIMNPYRYFKEHVNIFEALAQAGSLSYQTDTKRIKILRRVNGKEQILKFNIRSKDIVDSEYYYIEPNDIIFLSRAPNTFFAITSFTTLTTFVTSTLSFVLLVLNYADSN